MRKINIVIALAASIGANSAIAAVANCPVTHAELEAALKGAQSAATGNGGFGFHMWGTVVNRDGVVCAVARTGDDRGDQWPGSRVISAQKANTANSFSLPSFSLSTANLWAATQPGGSLFGLQFSNPVDTKVAYKGPSRRYGKRNDPMVGSKIGGVNVFGGGLALYDGHTIIGAVGVSGDSSCADHNIAWRTRDALWLDYVPAGFAGDEGDNIIFNVKSGFHHPKCSPGSRLANKVVLRQAPLSLP